MPHQYIAYTAANAEEIMDKALRTPPKAPVLILVPEPTDADNTHKISQLEKACEETNRKLGRPFYTVQRVPQNAEAKRALLKAITAELERLPAVTIIGPSVDDKDLPSTNAFFHEDKEEGESLKLFIDGILAAIFKKNNPTKKDHKRHSGSAKGAPLGGKTSFERRYLGTLHKLAQELTGTNKATPQEIGQNKFVIVVKKPKDEHDQDPSYRLIITPAEITLPTTHSDIAYDGFAKALSKFNPDPSKPFAVVLYHPEPRELAKMVAACEAQGMTVIGGGFTDEAEYEAHRKGFDVASPAPTPAPIIDEDEFIYRRRRTPALASP